MQEVELYIQTFPEHVQVVMRQIRERILSVVPEAEEGFSYKMPSYKLNGKPLVYFAGYKHHIGFYATPTGHRAFEEELARYKQGKGSVQFPLDQPMPLELIERIVRFRENESKIR